MAPLDPRTHARFLDYRDRHQYFGAGKPSLDAQAFAAADAEEQALSALGEGGRSDEDEARFVELQKLLHRD